MKDEISNPFNITKADDFSDQQINSNWVDVPGGVNSLVKPTSPMPMMILGGKGSGKTHLMRHFSSQLQKLRHGDDIPKGIISEGYLGIYLRCGGLNSVRFNGKGQSNETWDAVFAYYMELWLAQLFLVTVRDIFETKPEFAKCHKIICKSILNLFDSSFQEEPQCLSDVIILLSNLQKEADTAINNCVLTRKLDVTIRATAPHLTFGIPKILSEHIDCLKEILFLYLVDELENLTEQQQKYIYTLVRERRQPCSFKIGARLYGIKTFETYSAGEELKEGSEYEKLPLDTYFRSKKRLYPKFARDLCIRRLIESGYLSENETRANLLDLQFEQYEKKKYAQAETHFVRDKYYNRERPYFETLRRKMEQGIAARLLKGISSGKDVEKLIDHLRMPDFPLLEKVNTYLFYKSWYENQDLMSDAQAISVDCRRYIDGSKEKNRYFQALDHFQGDLLAQLLRECGQRQRYLGLDTFINMSSGLPRNLLIILKHIFQWAVFRGEKPFKEQPISIASQQDGVSEASEWFFQDARTTGNRGEVIRDSITRLATLFREIRFADKPSECSLTTFSVDDTRITPKAREVLNLAEKWSLLIKTDRGQRDRNTKRIDMKYQLNSMLSPGWDLPIYRRGVIALTPKEANAIFDPEYTREFEHFKKVRIDRMIAPFFGKNKNTLYGANHLPGL